jgi:hypothetical protein
MDSAKGKKASWYGQISINTPSKADKDEDGTTIDLKSSLETLEKQISQEELRKRRGI